MWQARIHSSITELEPDAWNALVPPGASPVIEHGYLAALERSGSLARVDFTPRHLTLWSGDRLVAATPAFLKRGEWGVPLVDWARRVATKHELEYDTTVYVGVPFAQAAGSKFLVDPQLDRQAAVGALAQEAKQLVAALPYSGVHCYFTDAEDVALLGAAGFHPRLSPRHLWVNEGYASFDAFLARLNSKRRSAVRRDLRGAAETGVQVRTLRGDALTDDVMALMARFHAHTIAKHGPDFDYYTPEFFMLLPQLLRSRVEVYFAERAGEVIAGSLHLASDGGLFVRTCGELAPESFVHFEVTWYQAIREAIARKLPFVDPNGPGDHKLNRGFVPFDFNHSASWCGDEDLDEAAGRLIAKERAWMPTHLAEQQQRAPWVTAAAAAAGG